MCGICVIVSCLNNDKEEKCLNHKDYDFKDLKTCLRRRGPDNFKTLSLVYKDKVVFSFGAAVLHLRGTLLTEQPITDQKENTLLWNGEIFGGPLIKSRIESDTAILADRLFVADKTSDILQIISSIEGPYAFIFYQANGLLWFGRDIFGRRSLLWNFENAMLQICSVGCGKAKWEEVPSSGVFCLDLNLLLTENNFIIHQYPWSSSASGGTLPQSATLCGIQIITHEDITVKVPITQTLNRTLPSDAVCSELLQTLSDPQNSILAEKELFHKILSLDVFRATVNHLEKVLSDAVKQRVTNELGLCKKCYMERVRHAGDVVCDHASVGVLFSGGLDSIVIACLVDRHLAKNKPLDLINVAFSSSQELESATKQRQCPLFDTPDRITGKKGIKDLENINPSRKWNLVEVNISKEELVSRRRDSISHLLNPSCSVLDDSIGCALWFASRGKGHLFDDQGYHDDYVSQARVLLVGMGADEQFAGYSRHRGKFNNTGWSGLIQEVSLELDRIGSRNLGRDDRIIADNGVESRYPFLDESVVSFLNDLPIWLKANLNFPRGVGEKLLLRLLAFKLGLTEAASLPKRAIQFGSRIAKIENAKEKGSDVCKRLTNLNS